MKVLQHVKKWVIAQEGRPISSEKTRDNWRRVETLNIVKTGAAAQELDS